MDLRRTFRYADARPAEASTVLFAVSQQMFDIAAAFFPHPETPMKTPARPTDRLYYRLTTN